MLTHAAAWNIMLNERSQSQKDKCATIPPAKGTQSGHSHGGGKHKGGGQGPGEGEWGVVIGTELQFGKMKKFWK